MQKITLLVVGSVKSSWIKSGCSDYSERLHRSFDFEVIEVSASKQKDSAKQQQEESDALLGRLENIDGKVWVLDETGGELSSQGFAQKLSCFADQGIPIIFVLGGAYGLSDDIKQKADHVVALSQMTFPHELCRVVFLEQLYRASQIQKGTSRRRNNGYGWQGGYHH